MKKKLLTLISTTVVSLSAFCAVILTKNEANLFNAKDETYSLVFNSTQNKFHNNTGATAYSGEATVKTNLDNDISFSYTDLMGLNTTWHVAKNGGGFYNTTPIHGINFITLSFKTDAKDFKLYWGGSVFFTESHSQLLTSSTSESTVFNFYGDSPTYFKFVNVSGSNLNISEALIDYSCKNEYPMLSISSSNDKMGSVSGSSGNIRIGANASITASPNTGYKFLGWYNGEQLVSLDSTYDFVMGGEDLTYIAHFAYDTYNFVVETESNEKGVVGNVSGSYDYLSPITIEATANDGYSFDGWYNGNSKISSANPYTFEMPYFDVIYTAKFSTNTYNLTLKNSNFSLGNISSSNNYLYGSSVTIIANPNTGVSFLGWYDAENNLVSNFSTFTFNMPHTDLEYTAKFEWTPYYVQISINDVNKGSVTGAGPYIYGQEVTLVAIPQEHCSFFGWFNGDTLLSREATYEFVMPCNSVNYEARFVKNHNLYIFSDDDTKGNVAFPSECGEGLEVTINAIGKNGYALDYWYDDDLNEISYETSYTFVMPNNDVTLYAAFVEGYALNVLSSDPLKGTVSGSGYYTSGRNVTIKMDYISGIFTGWFDSNDQFVSDDNPFTFVMPSNNYLLQARFMTQEEWDIAHGVIPTLSFDEKTLTYGLYPQNNVSDASLIATLNSLESPEANGWYFYQQEYYAKLIAKPYWSWYTFDNGTNIGDNTTYWFKCEPITWNVLENNNGSYYLLSTVLLDAYQYSPGNRYINNNFIYGNNYEYSDLRAWLNQDFYCSAFCLEDSHIQTTNVRNGGSTTDASSNQYACSNTEDKVFLPSYKDYLNSNYGFYTMTESDSSRCCRTTDWARARGARYNTTAAFGKNGSYWTRSPSSKKDYYVWQVSASGEIENNSDTSKASVRPAITLTLE